jgi:hypothetical protein
MQELTAIELKQVNGGGICKIIIYCVIGVGTYKVLKSTKGKISIPKLISLEWKS